MMQNNHSDGFYLHALRRFLDDGRMKRIHVSLLCKFGFSCGHEILVPYSTAEEQYYSFAHFELRWSDLNFRAVLGGCEFLITQSIPSDLFSNDPKRHKLLNKKSEALWCSSWKLEHGLEVAEPTTKIWQAKLSTLISERSSFGGFIRRNIQRIMLVHSTPIPITIISALCLWHFRSLSIFDTV